MNKKSYLKSLHALLSGPGVLYISYDGMLEPLGQSQVLAYLEQLAKERPIHLLSFEKSGDWARDEQRVAVAERIHAAGIHWHPRRYHKHPSSLATVWDIGWGALSAAWLVFRHGLRIIHARSDVPALMAWLVTRVTPVKFLYDMRGFWVDERVDGGLWPHDGILFRVGKWFERRFLLNADHVVVLTHAATRELGKYPFLDGRMPPLTVIPTCADLQRFKPAPTEAGPGFVLGYVGTAGTWYRFDALVMCFNILRGFKPDARLLIINRNEHDLIRERLETGGVPRELVELRAAMPEEVPHQMARMHATAFFIKQAFSKRASAPTKLAEFLGCGIPCLTNTGVGDMAEIIEKELVGVAVRGFEADDMRAGVERFLTLLRDPKVGERCRNAAIRHFSLERGVEQYLNIYRELNSDSETQPRHRNS